MARSRIRGLSPKLPLALDEQDGYALNKTYKEMVSQNLKMLILTVPGERMMDPLFGVGLKRYLFEMNIASVHGALSAKIYEQVKRYLPFLDLEGVDFYTSETNPELGDNYLHMVISYRIIPLDQTGILDVDLNSSALIRDVDCA
jgi:hypothetical protein